MRIIQEKLTFDNLRTSIIIIKKTKQLSNIFLFNQSITAIFGLFFYFLAGFCEKHTRNYKQAIVKKRFFG